ncbi:MAG: asparaginase [Betaproteobacteria bacterium]|nr:asparaginase [Betaproteobacteria bacterium]
MAAHAGLIDVHRGDVLESEHVGSIAVVNAAGELLAYCGDIRRDVFTRSSLKPFQAAPFVASGGLEKFGWGLRQLALMCASHSGETQHISLARSMLADCGLDHRHLLCGCQVPIAYTQAARLPRADEVFSELHHNCSLQRRIRESLAQALRRDSPFQLGVDGCAAPNLAMPLPQLAQLFAVMSAERSPGSFAEIYGDAAQQCFQAMTRYPDLVAGSDRSDLVLMQIGAGDWVCKAGAEAVQAIGIRSRGLGIAIKIADGNARAMPWIVVEIFRQLGIGDSHQRQQLQELVARPIRNVRGDAVGCYRPVFTLSVA